MLGVSAPFVEGPAEDSEGRFCRLVLLLMAVLRLVDRLRISLPFTTRLSLDFRRSRVIISAMNQFASSDIESCSLPSPPASKSITLPTRTLTTPRKPWSFFLNFFWSNIWTASMLSSLARLILYQPISCLLWGVLTNRSSHSNMGSAFS